MWGVQNREAHVSVYVEPRAQPKEKPSPRPWEGLSSAINVVEDEGSNLLLAMTPRVISRNSKSTKTAKDKGRNGNI